MRILLVEDEILAVERLSNMIHQYDSNIEIVAQFDSVRETVLFLNTRPDIDLAFFDIQLADGLSLDIFKQTKLSCPVIFTTAYNEYAIQAFKINAIDYLLKPISFKDLSHAFSQFKDLKSQYFTSPKALDSALIQQLMEKMTKQYKNRFIVKIGSKIASIPIETVLYFYSEHKTTYLKTTAFKKHAINYTLEELEGLLNPNHFFRLNRQFITSLPAIIEVSVYSNSRLKVNLLDLQRKDSILVGRDSVRDFKVWLDK